MTCFITLPTAELHGGVDATDKRNPPGMAQMNSRTAKSTPTPQMSPSRLGEGRDLLDQVVATKV
jgi:hypothetical protein